MYSRSELIEGRQATKVRFLDGAGRYGIVHFSGHGVANLRFPLQSRLVVESQTERSDGSDSLRADEIVRQAFPRTAVVVLGSCEGAEGAQVKGEGVLNLARPFLAAGVPMVIAGFAEITDRPARELFLKLHREISHGISPASALRRAQLGMLKGSDREFRTPAAWGLMAAFGGTIDSPASEQERIP